MSTYPASTPQEVVGTGLKAGTTIAGFGAPLAASVAGKVGMGAVEGGLTFGGQAIEEGKSAGEVAKEALGGAAFGAATVGVIGALSKTPGLLKGGGKALYSLTSKMEEPTKIAVQNYKASLPTLMERISGLFKPIAKTTEKEPITEAMTGLTRGLVGTERQMGVQAVRAQNKLWNNIISPTLKSSPLKVDMKVFFKTLGKQIFKEEADLTRRNALLKALDAMKNDYIKVGKVSLSKLQDYKSGWAKFLPQKAFQGEDIAGAFKEVQNLAAKNARQIIYENLGGDLKKAYIDYGNLESIAKLGRQVEDQLRAKGMSKQAWEFILDTAITPITTTAGQILYRTGSGLEFLGEQGAKTVGDLLGKTKNVIKEQTTSERPGFVNYFSGEVSKKDNPAVGQTADPLIAEAKKYKSAEEFVNSKLAPDSIAKKGFDTVYHETTPADAKTLTFAYGDKSGLYVSPSEDLALGQRGKGALVEFDTKRLESIRGNRPDLNGQPSEFQISNAPEKLTQDVKSVTFDKEPKGGFGNWNREVLPNGKIKYSNPEITQTKSQLTDIWNKAQK